MAVRISWLVKGYPFSIHLTSPTPADSNYIPTHVWINSRTNTAYILGNDGWSVRPPDYIRNEGTEYQVNVIEQVQSGTATTGAPPSAVTIAEVNNLLGGAQTFLSARVTSDNDHGLVGQLANIYFGTESPIDPTGIPNGSLYFQYTV